jgi:hypothetical protein
MQRQAFKNEILGYQFNKRLDAPCFSQSLLQADFKRIPYSILVLIYPYTKIRETRKSQYIHE